MRTWTARFGMMLGLALMVGLIVACGGGEKSEKSEKSGGSSAAASEITVNLAEWSVKPSAAKAKAGSVTFNVANKGATAHELAVLKTDADPAKLPQVSGAADEKQGTLVGRTASLDAGKSEKKSFDLKPGKYVLLCNLPAHYGQGMYAAFTVDE